MPKKQEYFTLKFPARVLPTVVQEMDRQVQDALAQGHHTIAFDWSESEYVDSYAVGVVFRAYQALMPKGGKVAVVCPSPKVKPTMDALDLKNLIQCFDTVEEFEKSL